ncbi:MAG: MarR family transcriptional regulator [Alphaproteobacteria bacterium]|nr:MarR family transcriptional regulator [Alphaproteobacteria bacterium]
MSQNLDRDWIIVLHDLARQMRTHFDQRAREFGMTRAQWVILSRLRFQPGASQNEMAAVCEVEPITVGRLVDRLEARGLVERRPDPTDRRVWRLHLLPAAEPVLKEINAFRETLHQRIAASLGMEKIEELVDTLLAIKENINTEGGEDKRTAFKG